MLDCKHYANFTSISKNIETTASKQLCKLVNIFINILYAFCLQVYNIVFFCKHESKQVYKFVFNLFSLLLISLKIIPPPLARMFISKNSPLDDRSKNRIILIH